MLILLLSGKYGRIKKLNNKFPEIEENIMRNEINYISKNFNLKNNIRMKKLGKRLFFFY